MLDVLVGVIVFFITQIVRGTVRIFGSEMGKNLVLLVAFIFALIFAYVQVEGIISTESIIRLSTIYGVAIGFYEVIYKRILLPIFEKVVDKISN